MPIIPIQTNDNTITDIELMSKIIGEALLNAYDEGYIFPNSKGDLKPSFNTQNLICIHTHCKGIGDGVYFRVKEEGQEVVYDRSFEKLEEELFNIENYDTVKN